MGKNKDDTSGKPPRGKPVDPGKQEVLPNLRRRQEERARSGDYKPVKRPAEYDEAMRYCDPAKDGL